MPNWTPHCHASSSIHSHPSLTRPQLKKAESTTPWRLSIFAMIVVLSWGGSVRATSNSSHSYPTDAITDPSTATPRTALQSRNQRPFVPYVNFSFGRTITS
ncbi:hypothetical protein EJ04DRAFT_515364 [Polyplosphaeria fusca]|uniref:Uncharacterized protein n=1 Tax=Polyplosphaeria fusca TaxID=682080 RepID=A0A9P4QMV7_9PLEO|nr:hypothetical protein EJ04DRAFT_515364 [Polyplosphaeria fusca]